MLRVGTEVAKQHLKPLIRGIEEDEYEDLKGIALKCCWPNNLTISELFSVLNQ